MNYITTSIANKLQKQLFDRARKNGCYHSTNSMTNITAVRNVKKWKERVISAVAGYLTLFVDSGSHINVLNTRNINDTLLFEAEHS